MHGAECSAVQCTAVYQPRKPPPIPQLRRPTNGKQDWWLESLLVAAEGGDPVAELGETHYTLLVAGTGEIPRTRGRGGIPSGRTRADPFYSGSIGHQHGRKVGEEK